MDFTNTPICHIKYQRGFGFVVAMLFWTILPIIAFTLGVVGREPSAEMLVFVFPLLLCASLINFKLYLKKVDIYIYSKYVSINDKYYDIESVEFESFSTFHKDPNIYGRFLVDGKEEIKFIIRSIFSPQLCEIDPDAVRNTIENLKNGIVPKEKLNFDKYLSEQHKLLIITLAVTFSMFIPLILLLIVG